MNDKDRYSFAIVSLGYLRAHDNPAVTAVLVEALESAGRIYVIPQYLAEWCLQQRQEIDRAVTDDAANS